MEISKDDLRKLANWYAEELKDLGYEVAIRKKGEKPLKPSKFEQLKRRVETLERIEREKEQSIRETVAFQKRCVPRGYAREGGLRP